MTTTQQLAEYVVKTSYDDFSPEVIQKAKDLSLSALGSAVLGAGMAVTQTLAKYALAEGGAQEAGVISGGYKTTAEWAAAINCTAAHCTELEDVAFPEAIYTCFLFPAVFAYGEALKSSGRDILEAVIIGYEVTCRPGSVCTEGGGQQRGHLTCAQLGTIGAAAAAAKLMGLNVEQTRNALSLAASMSAGLIRQTGTAAHVIEAGLAAKNGLMAARLAHMGLNGHHAIMEGKGGYWDGLAGQPDADFILGTGSDLRIMAVGMKKFPCCYLSQRIIDGLQKLRREHGIEPDQIEAIDLDVNPTYPRIFKYPEPKNSEEARFSLPHIVASALSGEKMLFETFTDEKIKDPALLALGKRLNVRVHNDWPDGQLAGTNPVTVRMKSGKSHSIDCVRAHGDPEDPLTPAEVIQKFRDSTVGLMPEADIQKAVSLLSSLETLTEVASIQQMLTKKHAA
jgi:2-methylcitrate dehydratase PrpD